MALVLPFALSRSVTSDSNPMDYSPPGFPVHGDSPGKHTGVGCHALLQGLFPTERSNPGLPHCRLILFSLSHQGSSRNTATSLSLFTFTHWRRKLQCSCLENPRDGGAWRAAVYGVAQSRTRLTRLSSSSSRLSVLQGLFPT